MCGIVGIVIDLNQEELAHVCEHMAQLLAHRGPDDSGVWIDSESGLGLGHRRLSIIDLSPLGHQPMHSASQRFVLSFNGEVYNFATLRSELEQLGASFRGASDTEVMLAAIEEWGVSQAVKRFNGMFAIALWDRRERVLHLVRDRLGIKPLFYGWSGGAFLFASEPKAFRAYSSFCADIDRSAVSSFVRFSYVPCPFSIFKGIYKLPPGCLLSLKLTDLRNKPADFSAQPDAGAVQRFWSVAAAVESGANSLVRDVGEAQERLEQTLSEAVRLRMISDVPLGAFLSGGIDSSMVVALMQRQATGKVKTFSIGFHEAQYNEATHAKLVAEHLGTDHTELYVTPAEAREVIPQLGSMYCEPFADSSQIPTYLLSRMTRQRVTVSLSGDGGDELFGGYSRYAAAKRVWEVVGWMPAGLRAIVAQMIRVLSPAQWDRVLSVLGPVVPEYFALREAGGKAHKLAAALEAATPERLYKQLVSHWGVLGEAVTDAEELTSVLDQVERWPGITSYLQHMCAMDMVSYLPDDILTKVDRASMAVALEARVPLLDHRVVELAWRIPDSMKLKDGKGKAILRDLLYRYVPQELVDRPKMGFGVPVGQWLRHELRDWAEDLLDSTALKNEGFLESSVIQDKWREHLSGRVNWQYYLWDVLMFQSWLREWRSNAVLDRKICNG